MATRVIDKLGRENWYGEDDGHWWTEEMMAGTETVEEHLATGHGQSEADLASLSLDQCHELHDRLHFENGDEEWLALMEALGLED